MGKDDGSELGTGRRSAGGVCSRARTENGVFRTDGGEQV